MKETVGCLGCLAVIVVFFVTVLLLVAGVPLLGALIAVRLWRQDRTWSVLFGVTSLIAFWPLGLLFLDGLGRQALDADLLITLPLLAMAAAHLVTTSRDKDAFAETRGLSTAICVIWAFAVTTALVVGVGR